jgi:nucleoside phosphorylase
VVGALSTAVSLCYTAGYAHHALAGLGRIFRSSINIVSNNLKVDFGFVFAMSMEAAGVVDLLERRVTTKGDGRVFHTGKLKNYSVAIVVSGIGQNKAASATKALLDVFCPTVIISAGYAGGLLSNLKRFSVHKPELLLRKSDGMLIEIADNTPKLVKKFLAVNSDCLAETQPKTNNDTDTTTNTAKENNTDLDNDNISNKFLGNRCMLVTVDQPVETAAAKLLLGKESGGEIVDMETFSVAEVCCNWRGGVGGDWDEAVFFSSVRIVLDVADEELPKEVKRIIHAQKNSTARMIGSTIGSFFKRPSVVFDLYNLKEHALQATDILAKYITTNIETFHKR